MTLLKAWWQRRFGGPAAAPAETPQSSQSRDTATSLVWQFLLFLKLETILHPQFCRVILGIAPGSSLSACLYCPFDYSEISFKPLQ